MVALGMCCLSSLTGHSNEHEVYRGLSRWTMYDLVSYFDCTQMYTQNNSAVLITRTFAHAHIYTFACTCTHTHIQQKKPQIPQTHVHCPSSRKEHLILGAPSFVPVKVQLNTDAGKIKTVEGVLTVA